VTDIRFLGHATFELNDGSNSVLIDPFLTGNPAAAVSADELSPDVILLTHGHGDHFADLVPIAKRTGATVITMLEIADELTGDGLANVIAQTSAGASISRRLSEARSGVAQLKHPEGTVALPPD